MKLTSNIVSVSRREFCKKTTMLATGGMLLSSLPAASAYALGSDEMKLALIGCGGRGTGAAGMTLELEKGVKLVAMADAFQDRLDESYEALSQKFGNSEKLAVSDEHKFVGLDGYKKAVELADIVILATPPGFRPAHFSEAVAQGKHVFMEKPVATDAPGVREILKAGEEAERKNLSVVVGLHRRYMANYHKVLNLLRDGRIGEIISGQVYWNAGGVWVRPRLPEYSELEYQLRNWIYFTWLAGDHILEQHIHNIDIANWFIGDYPVSAQGMGGREVRTGKEYGHIFDHHFVEFTYPNNIIISSQCRNQPNTWNRIMEVFQTTGGHIRTDGNYMSMMEDRANNLIYDHDPSDDRHPWIKEMDLWVESIRSGEIIKDTEHGAKSTLTAIMGRMATYTGKKISWDQALNSQEKLVPHPVDWNTEPPVLPDAEGYYPVPVPGKTEVI